MGEQSYWPDMVTEDYAAVHDCRFCAQKHTDDKHQRQLKLFFPQSSLEDVKKNILRPLPKTKQGNEFVVVMMDRYTKPNIAIPTTHINATTAACIFLDHFVENYGDHFRLLTDNGPHFLSKFVLAVFNTLRVNSTNTTEYSPETKDQTVPFSFTLIC